jgi:hypothetical protein
VFWLVTGSGRSGFRAGGALKPTIPGRTARLVGFRAAAKAARPGPEVLNN